MLSSLMTLIYAWSRILFFPPLVIALFAMNTVPPLGWPQVPRWRLGAAWGALVLVPAVGAVRIGEVDLVLLLLCMGVASMPADLVRAGAWWCMGVALLASTCQTLVVERMQGCLVPAQAVSDGVTWVAVLVCWLMALWCWPRETLPQRMSMWVIVFMIVHVCALPWSLPWLTVVMTVGGVLGLWWWLRRQPRWTPAVRLQNSVIVVIMGWMLWLQWPW